MYQLGGLPQEEVAQVSNNIILCAGAWGGGWL